MGGLATIFPFLGSSGAAAAAAAGGTAGILQAAGTVGSTLGSIFALSGQAAAERTNAEVARRQTQIEERQYRAKAARVLGKQEAILGATGLDPSQGSPLTMMLDSAAQAELDAMNIRYGGELTRKAALTRAGGYTRQIPFAALRGGATLLSQWMNR